MSSDWQEACDPAPERWKPSKSTLWRREKRRKEGHLQGLRLRLNGYDPATSISECSVDPDFDKDGF